jgi:hypothetical protein
MGAVASGARFLGCRNAILCSRRGDTGPVWSITRAQTDRSTPETFDAAYFIANGHLTQLSFAAHQTHTGTSDNSSVLRIEGDPRDGRRAGDWHSRTTRRPAMQTAEQRDAANFRPEHHATLLGKLLAVGIIVAPLAMMLLPELKHRSTTIESDGTPEKPAAQASVSEPVLNPVVFRRSE